MARGATTEPKSRFGSTIENSFSASFNHDWMVADCERDETTRSHGSSTAARIPTTTLGHYNPQIKK
jgi:hypothetical protein